jgi:hypothetical protein
VIAVGMGHDGPVDGLIRIDKEIAGLAIESGVRRCQKAVRFGHG